MPDPDKILEAEESIQNIASELKRMRKATQLLQETQEKADAVIDSAQRLTEDTQKRADEVIDSAQRLTEEMNELSTAIKRQNQDVQASIEEARIAVRETKMRQVTMMGFMIIALIMLLAILLKI